MPEVRSAEEATRIALDFARKYRGDWFLTPKSAQREDSVWVVEVGVGLFSEFKGRVRIDARTGEILDYRLGD